MSINTTALSYNLVVHIYGRPLLKWILIRSNVGQYQNEVNDTVFKSFVYRDIAVGDSIIKTGLMSLVKRFNHATCLYLSQARSWISNVICRGLFRINELKLEVIVRFVDINGIVDHRLPLRVRVRVRLMVFNDIFNNISGLSFNNHISKYRMNEFEFWCLTRLIWVCYPF